MKEEIVKNFGYNKVSVIGLKNTDQRATGASH